MRPVSRRLVLAVAPLALAACGAAEEAYFGNTRPPNRQRLTMVLEGEPESMDPALSYGLVDSMILSLFEGLTSLHPATCEAMAAIATHYELSADATGYTFYLRGHPEPRGTRLLNTGDLAGEYSRGRSAPPDTIRERWSDGRFVTAHDFVFSWRRALDPSLASQTAFLLYAVRNARQLNGGTAEPSTLGVRAVDDMTLQVDLEAPAPWFLEVLSSRVACAVPQHVIAAFGNQWTDRTHRFERAVPAARAPAIRFDRAGAEPVLL